MNLTKKAYASVDLINLCIKLFEHLKPKRKKSLVFLCFLTLICAFLEMLSMATVMPFILILTEPKKIFEIPLMGSIYDLLNFDNLDQITAFITIIFIIVIGAAMFMRILLLSFTTRLSFSIGADFGFDIYHKVLNEPYTNHLDRNSSEVVNGVFAKVNQVVYGIILSFLTLFNSVIILLIIFLTLIMIDFTITITSVFVFMGLYGAVIFLVNLTLEKHSKIIADFSTKILKNLQEGLGGIKEIILSSNQNFHTKKFRKNDLIFRQSQGSIHIISGSPRFLIEGLGMILIVILGYYASKTNEGFLDLIPTFGLMIFAAQRALPLLQQIYSGWANMKSVQDSLIDILKFLDIENKFNEECNDIKLIFKKNIIVSKASFYHKNSKIILNDVNIEIKKGQMIGFIGQTGTGKSTMVDILMGLLRLHNGSIKIDDKILKKSNIKKWQKLISHVPQKIFFLDNTISANIAFGIDKEKVDHSKIIEAAKKAEIYEFINNLSEGFNTYIGENGIKLSGGQQQRIALARALYKDAEILILDEATSALDDKTEKKLMKTIFNLKNQITVISIAHRISTLVNFDAIFKFENGTVTNMGSYENFMSNQFLAES